VHVGTNRRRAAGAMVMVFHGFSTDRDVRFGMPSLNARTTGKVAPEMVRLRVYRRSRSLVALGAALSMASACGGSAPTAPSPNPPRARLAVACHTPTLLGGELGVCMATAASENVSTAATWASSDPNILTSLGIGAFRGKSDGQATVTATYSGDTVSTALTVRVQDVLRAQATADQGNFQVGATVTLWLLGFYGVASADSGRLTLVIMDQNGATISTSAPLVVPRGGDGYNISTTFTLPPGTTRACRAAALQIGSTTLTAVPDGPAAACRAVMS
jgi:hypothetical protein